MATLSRVDPPYHDRVLSKRRIYASICTTLQSIRPSTDLHYHNHTNVHGLDPVGLTHIQRDTRGTSANARGVAGAPRHPQICRLPTDCSDQTRGAADGTSRHFRGH